MHLLSVFRPSSGEGVDAFQQLVLFSPVEPAGPFPVFRLGDRCRFSRTSRARLRGSLFRLSSFFSFDATLSLTCAFLSSPPVLPPKMGDGVLGSSLGSVHLGFSGAAADASFPSARTTTLARLVAFLRLAVRRAALVGAQATVCMAFGTWKVRSDGRSSQRTGTPVEWCV